MQGADKRNRLVKERKQKVGERKVSFGASSKLKSNLCTKLHVFFFPYGSRAGLNENGSHVPGHSLSSCCCCLGRCGLGEAVLPEVRVLGVGVGVSEAHTRHNLALSASNLLFRCEFSAPAAAPCLPVCCHAPCHNDH